MVSGRLHPLHGVRGLLKGVIVTVSQLVAHVEGDRSRNRRLVIAETVEDLEREHQREGETEQQPPV